MRVALDDIIDHDGGGCHGPADDEEGAEGEHANAEVVLQRGAEDAETDGEHDEGGDPEAVQPVFGLPDAAAPLADVHGQAVVDEVAVDLGGADCDPAGEGV